MANTLFYPLTGHDPAVVKVGIHNEEVLRAATARRAELTPGLDVDAYIAALRQDFREPSGEPIDAELFPGHWLRTQRHRTADGGLISIVVDISDLKRAEQRPRDAIEEIGRAHV